MGKQSQETGAKQSRFSVCRAKAGPTSFLLFLVYLYLIPDTFTFPGPRLRAYLPSILGSSGERPSSTLGKQGTSSGLCPHFSAS